MLRTVALVVLACQCSVALGGLAADLTHQAGINPLWPHQESCLPPVIYPGNQSFWIHGTPCDGLELRDYQYGGTCELRAGQPRTMGTEVKVLGQPCTVELSRGGQPLATWTFQG